MWSKRLDSAKKSATDAIKTISKRAIQETAEAAGGLIGNKIADKITSVSKKSSAQSEKLKNDTTNDETEKKIHISRRKTTNYWWTKVSTTI